MQSAIQKSGTAFKRGTAILMARLVDGNGTPILPASVRAIDCSIYEIDPDWPYGLTIVAGYDKTLLTVADVVSNSLRTDELWTIDKVGYNFRHEINFDGHQRFPKAGFQYQLRYRLTDINGVRTIVRFITSPSGRGRDGHRRAALVASG